MKHLLTAIILLAAFGFANAQKDAAIDKILKANEKYQTVSCDFTQVKTMAMVDQKIESAGTLYFNRADKLKMVVYSSDCFISLISIIRIMIRIKLIEILFFIKETSRYSSLL